MQFEFLSTPRILFGRNQFRNFGPLIKELGSRLLVVASKSALNSPGINDIITVSTSNHEMEFDTYLIKGEPTIEAIDLGVQKANEFQTDVVMGLGGGSAIDACKAIAGLITNKGSAKDYMEVIGKGSELTQPSLPIIAVPTTAGTGSEVTKNAVILAEKEKLKASIRSHILVPKITIVDPELMLSVPPSITAICGMDALTQLIEAYTSNKSQQITDALALLGVRNASNSLLTCYRNGQLTEAREKMALASLLSGICLANAGLGAVHGIASPMGGLNVPHGVICAALLAPIIELNIKQLKMKDPVNLALKKYAKLGEIVTDKKFPSINDAQEALIDFLKKLTQKLNIPTLSGFNLTDSDLKTVAVKAQKSSSMRYNPIHLSEDILIDKLNRVI